jgi:fructose-1,6-bisphosphatase/inositol monophosphatase family enzyme
VKHLKALLYAMADEVQETVRRMQSKVNIGEDLGLGADGTPTKLIDDAAELVCLKILDEGGEELNILSEEVGYIDNKAKETLVIDPIDGTHNAIKGIPFYAISLAVGKTKLSDVKYGLVRNLVTGDTFWAEKGKGATLNDEIIKVRPFIPDDSMFSVYMGERATERSLSVAKMPRRGRAMGCASLEMCLVASGAFDVYYLNYSPSRYSMRVMDIAASTLILREAGGEVFNDAYDILDMDFDIDARTNLIAVGDPRALQPIRNLEIMDMGIE